MFRGEHPHAVDDKGRVALPTKFREALAGLQDERLVATKSWYGDRPCLDVYPLSSWVQKVEQPIIAANQFDPDVLAFSNLYIAPAQDIVCDKQGRILIPSLLREHAGLEREVMIVGFVTKFAIWNRPAWQEVQSETSSRAPEILRRFGRT